MGLELACDATLNASATRGRALLEHDHLRFRGEDTRVRVTLSELESVRCEAGRLRLRWAGGELILALGEPQAQRWADRILSPKSAVDKLGISEGCGIALSGRLPDDFLAELGLKPANTNVCSISLAAIIFHGISEPSDLLAFQDIRLSMTEKAACWAVWRKGKTGPVKEAEVFTAARASGLVDVKVVAISPTHTAQKFVIPAKSR